MKMPAQRRFACASFLAISLGLELTGQSSVAPPAFKSLRYDEDYRYLQKATDVGDYLDAIKFIPLPFGPEAFLSLGGEARLRYEYYRNAQWGQGPQDRNGFFLQRYMLHADAVLNESFRVFAQLKSGIESGRVGGPRPTDEDRLDLNQAFFDAKWPLEEKNSFTLRVGRQELAFGSSRVISFREGPNVQQAFDGFRGTFQTSTWRFDALAAEPVQTKVGTFDDGSDSNQKLWGVYAVTPLPALPGGHLDLYYLNLVRDVARFDQGSAREERRSFGARLWGSHSGWDYNFEFIYQGGTFGHGRIEAWTIASDTGYTFAQARGRPRLSLKADIASGDRDPNQADLQTFNPLFPRGSYFNESSLIGPDNFIDLHPGIELKVAKGVTVFADCDFFWRESVRDGVYGPAVNLVRSGRSSAARYVGTQPAVSMQWRPSRHWSFAFAYAHFHAGRFLRETGHGRDVDFVTTSSTYQF